MSLSFVNYRGDAITESQIAAMRAQGEADARQKKAAQPAPDGYHKGFRVLGIAPLLVDKARETHESLRAIAKKKTGGKELGPFDTNEWVRTVRPKALRSKPYELESAAQLCLELAKKQGWLALRIVEVSRA